MLVSSETSALNKKIVARNISLVDRMTLSDFTCSQGQHWHLLGPNGAGKSSLLCLLSGLVSPDSGHIEYDHAPLDQLSITSIAKNRAFLYQHHQSEFDIPAKQLLAFFTQYSVIPDEIDAYLDVNAMLNKPLSEMSGGQQQRFHIARCLTQVWPSICKGNALLLLDEPMQHLDIKYQQSTMQMLNSFTKLGCSIVASCHDINITQMYASHVGFVYKQKLFAQGCVANTLSLANINQVYEHSFCEIVDTSSQQKYFASTVNKPIK